MPSWANDDTDVTMHKTYMQSCVYASLPPCVVEHDLPGHPSFRILTTITKQSSIFIIGQPPHCRHSILSNTPEEPMISNVDH